MKKRIFAVLLAGTLLLAGTTAGAELVISQKAVNMDDGTVLEIPDAGTYTMAGESVLTRDTTGYTAGTDFYIYIEETDTDDNGDNETDDGDNETDAVTDNTDDGDNETDAVTDNTDDGDNETDAVTDNTDVDSDNSTNDTESENPTTGDALATRIPLYLLLMLGSLYLMGSYGLEWARRKGDRP